MNRRAAAHAKHAYTCTRCGKVVHGNGARAAHRAMHERRNEPARMRHWVPGDGQAA